MVQSWKVYPAGEQLPVYANMFRLACKAVGITMFGDYYRNDKNVEEFQKLYTVVQTNLNLDKTLKYTLLTSNSLKHCKRCIKLKTKYNLVKYASFQYLTQEPRVIFFVSSAHLLLLLLSYDKLLW